MRRRGVQLRIRAITVVVAGATLAAACTNGGGSESPSTVVTTTTEVAEERVNDGVLTIGALIPSGESGLREALQSSIEEAVEAVNEAGGVLGNDVRLIPADEGETPVSASQAIEDLVDRGVDAIVGPASSNTAIGALDEAVAAGVVTCSATATAIALDDFPDNELFFRSIATDSLQAIAIAREAQATGASSVVIVHVDDAYGRPYADAVAEALGNDIEVETIPIPVGTDDITQDLERLATIAPQVVVSIGSGADTARFLESVGRSEDFSVPTIIVNDAARSAATRPVIAALPSTVRSRVVVIAPQIVLRQGANAAADPPFGPQVTDCVNLLALAAIQGDSDSPQVIAGQMSSVSDGGAVCNDFATCALRLIDDQEIDYDGPTGITDLGRDGDPSRAFFDRFRFGADGEDIFERAFAVQA